MDLEDQGPVESSGTFTLDPVGLGKLAAHQLGVPWSFRLISAAIMAGSSRVEVWVSSGKVSVDHNGAAPPRLETALSWLGHHEPAQQALSEGLLAALKSGASLEVSTWKDDDGQRLRAEGTQLQCQSVRRSPFGYQPWTTRVQVNRKGGLKAALRDLFVTHYEVKSITKRFRLASPRLALVVNGKRVNAPFDLGPCVALCYLDEKGLDPPQFRGRGEPRVQAPRGGPGWGDRGQGRA